jgi:dipeptidyl aminopeptidase/acylaminoacyl peptidase
MQMLLAQGFAVLLPNVRGSSGYGRAYTESDDVERRLDSVADLAHGRHWLAVIAQFAVSVVLHHGDAGRHRIRS